ncbi:hypothetical protein LCGC14_2737720 [marine sediment metagenome]|uniref:Uncharacterized protein n=1 Tax=marine sediment metagenome TaxID=412755 RepID=A0A0F8ZSM7_9ZZZZ|nr:hypothetical protein [bacterium]
MIPNPDSIQKFHTYLVRLDDKQIIEMLGLKGKAATLKDLHIEEYSSGGDIRGESIFHVTFELEAKVAE